MKLELEAGGSPIPLRQAAGFYGTTIAEGALISATMQPSRGVAINAAKTVIVPISMAKTDVLPML